MRAKRIVKMDNRNVFVAIALSMSVLLFWGAFFETPKKPINPKENQRNWFFYVWQCKIGRWLLGKH